MTSKNEMATTGYGHLLNDFGHIAGVLLHEANRPANAMTAHRGQYETGKKDPDYHHYRQRIYGDVFPIPVQHACPLRRPLYLFTPSNTQML